MHNRDRKSLVSSIRYISQILKHPRLALDYTGCRLSLSNSMIRIERQLRSHVNVYGRNDNTYYNVCSQRHRSTTFRTQCFCHDTHFTLSVNGHEAVRVFTVPLQCLIIAFISQKRLYRLHRTPQRYLYMTTPQLLSSIIHVFIQTKLHSYPTLPRILQGPPVGIYRTSHLIHSTYWIM